MITLKENMYRSVKPSEAKDLDKKNQPTLLFALKKNEVVLVQPVASGKVTAIAGGDGGTAGLSFRNMQSFHNRRDSSRSVWLDSHMWLDTDMPFEDFKPGNYLIGAAYIPRFEWLIYCLEKGEDFVEINTAAVERLDVYKCYMLAAGTRLPTGYMIIEDDTPAGHRTLTFKGEKILAVSKVKKRTMYVAEELGSVSASDHCVLIRASARPPASTTAPMAVFNLNHDPSTHTPSNTTIDTTSSTTSNTTTCATPSTKHIPEVLALAGEFYDILPDCDVEVDEELFSWLSSARISNYSLESAKPLFIGQLAGMVYKASAHLSFDAVDLLDRVKQMLAEAEEGEGEELLLSKPEQEDPPEEISNQTFEKAKKVGVAEVALRPSKHEDKVIYQPISAAHLENNDIPAVIKAYGSAQMEAHDKAIERNIKNLELDLKKQEELQYINPELGLEAKERGNARFHEGDFPGAIKEYEEAIRRDPNNALNYNTLAAANQKMGVFNDAKTEVERSLEIQCILSGATVDKVLSGFQDEFKTAPQVTINGKDIFAKVEKLSGENPDYTDVETVGTLSAGSSLPGSGNKGTRAQSTDSDTGCMLPAVNLFASGILPTTDPSARCSSSKSDTPVTSPDTPGKEQRKQMQRTSKAKESAVQTHASYAGEQPKVKT